MIIRLIKISRLMARAIGGMFLSAVFYDGTVKANAYGNE